jgi:hypothetical protein
LFDSFKNGAEIHLLTDGRAIHLETNDRNIVDILKNAKHPMISVCVSDQVKRLLPFTPPLPKKVGRETASARARQARATG